MTTITMTNGKQYRGYSNGKEYAGCIYLNPVNGKYYVELNYGDGWELSSKKSMKIVKSEIAKIDNFVSTSLPTTTKN